MGTLHTASPLRVVRTPLLFFPIPLLLLLTPEFLLPFATGRGATAGSSTSRVSPELRVDARGRVPPPLVFRRNGAALADFLAGTVFFFGLVLLWVLVLVVLLEMLGEGDDDEEAACGAAAVVVVVLVLDDSLL